MKKITMNLYEVRHKNNTEHIFRNNPTFSDLEEAYFYWLTKKERRKNYVVCEIEIYTYFDDSNNFIKEEKISVLMDIADIVAILNDFNA